VNALCLRNGKVSNADTSISSLIAKSLSFELFASCGGRLPPSWCNIITKMCQECENHPIPPVSRKHFVASPASVAGDPLQILCPEILLWSPLEQFPDLLKDGLICPKCTEGRNHLSHAGWKDGQNGIASEPRTIQGVNGILLLSSRVYKCACRHVVLGYHPGVLKQIPVES